MTKVKHESNNLKLPPMISNHFVVHGHNNVFTQRHSFILGQKIWLNS
jgi:hypothetical protein